MHEYDTVLKSLLQDSQNSSIFEQITGVKPERWLNVEFPEVRQTRVDLLVETAGPNSSLINLELQSTNDPSLPLRMAEYALRVYRIYQRFPRQYVLYVGEPELRITSELAGDDFLCRFTVKDVRMLDEEALLKSPFDSDAIIAILLRHADRRETIRRILARIAKLETGARESAYAKLLILAGLRKLEETIQTEVKQMPILNDIMDHKIIGPAIRQGLQQGLQQGLERGLEQGRQEGRQAGELSMLRGLIRKRFGSLPPSIDERLSNLSVAELEAISIRLFDARTLTDLIEP